MTSLIQGMSSNLDVTLVYPPDSQLPFTRSGTLLPPMGIAYLASVLRHMGQHVSLIDLSTRNDRGSQESVEEIVKTHPHVVGISTLSYSWRSTRNLIEALRQDFDGVIVAGGPHTTAVGGKVLQECPSIDYGIRGEAELSFPQLLHALTLDSGIGAVPGLTYRNEKGITLTTQPALPIDLNALPFPAWDSLDLEPYRSPYTPSGRVMPMMASRGCPYTCPFCDIPVVEGRAIRYRAASLVVDELEWLASRFGARDVVFNDNVFTLNRTRTVSLLQEMIRRKSPIRWMCSTRVEKVDEEIFRLMREAGCFRVYFGLESGSKVIQRHLRKTPNLELARERIRQGVAAGITIEAGFIVGLPYDSRDTILDTIEYANTLPTSNVQFSYYLPLPGTKLYDDYAHNTYSLYSPEFGFHNKPSFVPSGMSADELQELVRAAYARATKPS